MIEALTRLILTAVGLLGGYTATKAVDWHAELGLDPNYVIFLFVILGAAIGFLLGGILGREMTAGWKRIEERLASIAAPDLLLGIVGLVVGLLVAFLVAQPLRFLSPAWLAIVASVAVYTVLAEVGVSIAMGRRREFALLFPRFFAAQATETQPMAFLDTSAVIDSRFLDLRKFGYLPDDIRVPRFVLAELQTLADSADDTRRSRGRRGLDLLASLPKDQGVQVAEVDYPELPAVDDKLMRLAADTGAAIITVDYNLTKVARVRGLQVLNLNEAAAVLKPVYIPGDSLHLLVAKHGKEHGQGVGYLEDGTMVVVQDGREKVGSETDVEVTSVLQTNAGRMIFARPVALDATDEG